MAGEKPRGRLNRRRALNLVAGAVLMDPRVSGEAVDLGLVGNRPVSQPQRSFSANLDYKLPFDRNLSVDMGIQHLGDRTGSVNNLLTVPGRTLVDIGGRYRFTLKDSAASLRLRMTNIFDEYAVNVSANGAFRRVPPRQARLTFSLDL